MLEVADRVGDARPGTLRRRARKLASPALIIELVSATAVFASFGQDKKADLAVFLKAGHQVLMGTNPYQPNTSPLLLDGHAFVYPWLSAFLFSPLSVLPSWLAMNLFTVLGIAAVLVSARWLGVPRGLATAALLLCAPFARNAELGAVNAIFFFLLAAMWHWRDRTWVVASAVTLLVGVKLFLAPVLLWVVLTRSYRCAAWTMASVATFFFVSFTAGPLTPGTYTDLLRRLSDHMGQQGMGFQTAIAHFFPGSPAQAIALGVVALGLVITLLTTGLWRPHNEAGLLGAIVLLSVVASPMVWRHYLLLVFFVVALVHPTAKALVASAVASWFVVGTQIIPPIGLSYDQRLIALYALMAVLFVLCLRTKSTVRGPQPRTADQASDLRIRTAAPTSSTTA